MASHSISCSHIRERKHLTTENLSKIFQNYNKDVSLKVEKVLDNDDQSDVGAHYQSDITRLAVQLEGQEHPLQLIVKSPYQTFHQKYVISKMNKPFMRESFWYAESVPSLNQVYPEVETIGPKCYHATSAYDDDYR